MMPALAILGDLAMCLLTTMVGIMASGDTAIEVYVAAAICFGWATVYGGYVFYLATYRPHALRPSDFELRPHWCVTPVAAASAQPLHVLGWTWAVIILKSVHQNRYPLVLPFHQLHHPKLMTSIPSHISLHLHLSRLLPTPTVPSSFWSISSFNFLSPSTRSPVHASSELCFTGYFHFSEA